MPNPTKKLTRVYCEDWEGVYLDGVLVAQGHSVDISDVAAALGVEYQSVEADSDWLEDEGELPESLSDVKRSE